LIKNAKNGYDNSVYFLTPNDYLIYKLCGVCVTDYLNATKYHYDVRGKTYPTELLERLETSDKVLPTVVNTGEKIGKLDTLVAESTGLSKEVDVVAISYDTICSFIGSGVSQEGEASDVSGTVTVFRA